MGTPDFAVASLKVLCETGMNIVGVITAPDKPAGRGRQLQESAVKQFAAQAGLKIMQPENLKNPAFIEELEDLKADLQIVVAFRMLPETVWNMPRLGTYNLHASLLPKYRGAAPINWAIINGEKESGVTTFKLKHEIDSGNILFSEKVTIENNTTAGELHDVLMHKGAMLLVKTVREIERCDAAGTEPAFIQQNETEICHAPKIFRDTCRIQWNKPARSVYNLVRGLSPYPAAFCELRMDERKLLVIKLFAVEISAGDEQINPGSIKTDGKNYLKIKCVDGWLSVLELQAEGKRRMKTEEFLRGFVLAPEACML